MTRAPLRHVPLLTGDVRLTLVGDDGREVAVTVDAIYLRAKCIGILADIDPAGLVQAALGQRTTSIQGDHEALSVADKVLIALRSGPKTARGLRQIVDKAMSAQDLGGRTTQLREGGLIYRIDEGAGQRGGRAIWKLTSAGELRAAQLAGKAQ